MAEGRPYIISTDSTADLPVEYIREHNIYIHELTYMVDDKSYSGITELSAHEFYDKMREGSSTGTAASNFDYITQAFTARLDEGFDVLHISFSSGLSSTYSNAAVIASQLSEERPDTKVIVVDSLSASMGQGLLVYYAVKLKEEGRSIEEVADWLNENRLHFCHQFTVEDLKYLARGGRISKTAALLGTLINVKPVLHVDDEGHLVALSKVRGRKKSLTALVDNMAAQIGDYDNSDMVMISHGDCIDDAQTVADMVRERFGIKNIMINPIYPTVGAHSGPGTVALFHLGKSRMLTAAD